MDRGKGRRGRSEGVITELPGYRLWARCSCPTSTSCTISGPSAFPRTRALRSETGAVKEVLGGCLLCSGPQRDGRQLPDVGRTFDLAGISDPTILVELLVRQDRVLCHVSHEREV